MHILTLRRVIVTLGQILGYAVRHGYIVADPLANAERPRDVDSTEGTMINILPPEKISAFIEATQDHKYRTLFRLAIMSGARQGELFGLKWTDILWATSQIHIRRTFNNGAWYKPKTRTSKRKIDLGPAMMAELKRWRLACPPSKLDLVFPNSKGQPLAAHRMRRGRFYPALKEAGIERIRFHDLRHTFASILIEQGENIKYIQNQLGHANPTTTLNVYSHLIRPTNQKAARQFEEGIFGTAEKAKNHTGHSPVTIKKNGS